MSGTTSVQIAKESSALLDRTAKQSGLTKSYLANVAISYFYDPVHNPGLEEALQGLSSGRKRAEEDFIQTVLSRLPEKQDGK